MLSCVEWYPIIILTKLYNYIISVLIYPIIYHVAKHLIRSWKVNSLWPSDTMCHRKTLVLVQVMACCLLSAKSLPETMVTFCQLDPLERSLKWQIPFWFNEMHMTRSSAKCEPFCFEPQCVETQHLMPYYPHHLKFDMQLGSSIPRLHVCKISEWLKIWNFNQFSYFKIVRPIGKISYYVYILEVGFLVVTEVKMSSHWQPFCFSDYHCNKVQNTWQEQRGTVTQTLNS